MGTPVESGDGLEFESIFLLPVWKQGSAAYVSKDGELNSDRPVNVQELNTFLNEKTQVYNNLDSFLKNKYGDANETMNPLHYLRACMENKKMNQAWGEFADEYFSLYPKQVKPGVKDWIIGLRFGFTPGYPGYPYLKLEVHMRTIRQNKPDAVRWVKYRLIRQGAAELGELF